MEVHSLQEYLSIINELMCNYTYSIQNLPKVDCKMKLDT